MYDLNLVLAEKNVEGIACSESNVHSDYTKIVSIK